MKKDLVLDLLAFSFSTSVDQLIINFLALFPEDEIKYLRYWNSESHHFNFRMVLEQSERDLSLSMY